MSRRKAATNTVKVEGVDINDGNSNGALAEAPSAGLASGSRRKMRRQLRCGVKLNPSCGKRSNCDPADHEIPQSKHCRGRNRRMEQSELVSKEVLSRRMRLLVILAIGDKTAIMVTAASYDIFYYTNVLTCGAIVIFGRSIPCQHQGNTSYLIMGWEGVLLY